MGLLWPPSTSCIAKPSHDSPTDRCLIQSCPFGWEKGKFKASLCNISIRQRVLQLFGALSITGHLQHGALCPPAERTGGDSVVPKHSTALPGNPETWEGGLPPGARWDGAIPGLAARRKSCMGLRMRQSQLLDCPKLSKNCPPIPNPQHALVLKPLCRGIALKGPMLARCHHCGQASRDAAGQGWAPSPPPPQSRWSHHHHLQLTHRVWLCSTPQLGNSTSQAFSMVENPRAPPGQLLVTLSQLKRAVLPSLSPQALSPGHSDLESKNGIRGQARGRQPGHTPADPAAQVMPA